MWDAAESELRSNREPEQRLRCRKQPGNSSKTAVPEATPDWGQPSSTTTTLCVFVTDLTMASRSMGLSVRRLITCITAMRTLRCISRAWDQLWRMALATSCCATATPS